MSAWIVFAAGATAEVDVVSCHGAFDRTDRSLSARNPPSRSHIPDPNCHQALLAKADHAFGSSAATRSQASAQPEAGDAKREIDAHLPLQGERL